MSCGSPDAGASPGRPDPPPCEEAPCWALLPVVLGENEDLPRDRYRQALGRDSPHEPAEVVDRLDPTGQTDRAALAGVDVGVHALQPRVGLDQFLDARELLLRQVHVM